MSFYSCYVSVLSEEGGETEDRFTYQDTEVKALRQLDRYLREEVDGVSAWKKGAWALRTSRLGVACSWK
jgi:hypothetical protein